MKKRALIIDCRNLGYIAFYSMGDLSFEEKKTGVIFGFFQQLLRLAKKFETDRFIFCWDSRKSYREIVYPPYKNKRNIDEKTDEEKEDLLDAFRQFDDLRLRHLPRFGFGNIFMEIGYEADDLIAKACLILCGRGEDKTARPVIVSSDEDMFQLLNFADQYSPQTKKFHTIKSFEKTWGIKPPDWAKAKAWAGCASDNVEGIRGVAEATAVKYLKGQLKPTSKIFQKIEANKDVYERNIGLVSLPYENERFRPLMNPKVTAQSENFIVEDAVDVFDSLDFRHFLKKDNFQEWRNAFRMEREEIPF